MNAPVRISDLGGGPLDVSCDTATNVIRAGRSMTRVSPAVLMMVAVLLQAYPRPVPRDRIMKRVFGGRRDIKDPGMCLRSTMKRARTKLKPLGVFIVYTPNPESSDLPGYYSLSRVEPPGTANGGAA